jgi:hypothetical protein
MNRVQDNDDESGSLRRPPQTVALRQRIVPSCLSILDVEKAIDALTVTHGGALTETRDAGEHNFNAKDHGQVLGYTEDPELDDRVPLPTNLQEDAPLFSSRAGGMQETPICSSRALSSPPTLPAWNVFAPDIEQAIQTLSARLDRAPTQTEVSDELHIDLKTYRQVLSYLKDLGIGTLYDGQTTDSGEEELAYMPNGPRDDDVLYRCLRSELQDLLTAAIRNLPERERLVITLHYYEHLHDREILLTLGIAESTVSIIRTSVHLHLRASLASSMLSEQLRNLHNQRVRARSADGGDTKLRDLEEAHVVVNGSQSGWLPKGHSWERFGEHALWSRHFMSWYSLNDEQELTQIRRSDQYHLKLSL